VAETLWDWLPKTKLHPPLLRGEAVTIGLTTWLWAIASGLIYYAFAFWFYIVGLKRVPASTAGQFLNLIPVFGVAGATIFLGERLGVAQWLGAILILAAVAGIVRGQQRAEVAARSLSIDA
jgi:drug/metabolite transporter (DMT)-like permease